MDVEVAKLELNTPFDLFFLVEWFVNILSFLWSNLFGGFECRNILNALGNLDTLCTAAFEC